MQKAHPSFKAPGPGPFGVPISGCHGPCAQPLAPVPSLGLAGSPPPRLPTGEGKASASVSPIVSGM